MRKMIRWALYLIHALRLPESRGSLAHRLFLLHESGKSDQIRSLRWLFPARRRKSFI